MIVRKLKLSLSQSLIGLTFCAWVAVCLIQASVTGQPMTAANFEIKFQLNSQLLKGYLSYPKSNLGNFYKINIVMSDIDGKNPAQYEDLFSCSRIGGQAGLIGCRRYAGMDISKKHVVIEMKFSDKEPSEEEVTASSYAVAPILVELLMNDNFAGVVSVPASSYDQFMKTLTNQGWQPASQTVGANQQLISIQLQSDPLGRSDALFYQPSLKK